MKRTPYRKPKKARVVDSEGNLPKKHHFKPGTVALREIKRMQKRTDFLIRKRPFCRLVREMISETLPGSMVEANPDCVLRVQSDAFEALQEASEAYLTDIFIRATELTTMMNMVTMQPKHLHMAVKSI